MEEKNIAKVAALKLDDGNDILGYFLGETPAEDGAEAVIMLYRPIYILQKVQLFKDVPLTSYSTSMYFRYGSQVVHIPYSKIVTHDMASDFFAMFYARTIGELMVREEIVHKSYISFYENRDTKEAMAGTDSILVSNDGGVLQ